MTKHYAGISKQSDTREKKLILRKHYRKQLPKHYRKQSSNIMTVLEQNFE